MNVDEKWTFLDHLPPPLVNVICERPPRLWNFWPFEAKLVPLFEQKLNRQKIISATLWNANIESVLKLIYRSFIFRRQSALIQIFAKNNFIKIFSHSYPDKIWIKSGWNRDKILNKRTRTVLNCFFFLKTIAISMEAIFHFLL